MNRKDSEDTKKAQENVFGLEDPDNWVCTVDTYISGHSQLYIRAYNENFDEEVKFGFEGVEYFSGAMSWTGANFRLHSRDECIKFWTEYRPGFQTLVNDLRKSNMMSMFQWKLYTVLTKAGNTIQILAINGGL